MLTHLHFLWADTPVERFVQIMKTFGEYWETRGQDPDTLGMFSVMTLPHQSNSGFGISVQFCNPDGTCRDLTVLNKYLDRFAHCSPATMPGGTIRKPLHDGLDTGSKQVPAEELCIGSHPMRRRDWLAATGDEAGGPGGLAPNTSPRT